MSAIADSYIVAIQRAFPQTTATEIVAISERFFDGNATMAESEAIEREFAKVTRADIGRPPLPDTLPADVLDAVVAGVHADLDGTPRRCCDCDGWFDGAGPRCPACVDLRNAAGKANDLTLLQRAAGATVDAIEAALASVDAGKGFGTAEYENLWDAMINLKNELPKA
jgi:hypothetical protein